MDRLHQLHHAHGPAVRAYALRRIDPATADDVCAEVWATAWRRLDAIPADALPWLLGVARRALANQRRGERRLLALRARLAQDVGAASMGASGDRTLGEALSRLRPIDREALLLVAWEGLSHEQAAETLGVKPNAFAVRMHRARRRLAELLDEDGVEVPSVHARPKTAKGSS